MKNLASLVYSVETDDQIKKELKEAGINAHPYGDMKRNEVKTKYMGFLHGWSFERAWNYWIVNGPGLPPKYANELHISHGQEVRVGGDASCPSPIGYYKGFGVTNYHVDTQEGLNALASTFCKVVKEAEEDVRIKQM